MFKSSKLMLSLLAIVVLSGCAASAPTISAPVRAGADAVAAPVYRNSDEWVYQVPFAKQAKTNELVSITAMASLHTMTRKYSIKRSWTNVYRIN